MGVGKGGFWHAKVICAKVFIDIRWRQKIAAFGSSYRGMCCIVGAAEGCDLLNCAS